MAEKPPAEVHLRYETIPGGWRCLAYIPDLDPIAREFGREPGDPVCYGEGPTKEEAKAVLIDYLDGQAAAARHVTQQRQVLRRLTS